MTLEKICQMLGAFYIAEIARSSERKKMNSRVPRIISARFLKPTKKKGWLGERKKDEVARYAVSSVVRRSLEVTWGLPRWIVQATRGRAEVPVWWNGSRVIEILCSLPSRYDVRRGPSFLPFLSFSLPSRILSFFILRSPPPLPPLYPFRSRYLLLRILLLLILSKRYPDPFTCHVRETRTRAGRARGPKLPARDYKPIISSQILRRASCGPKPAWLRESRQLAITETGGETSGYRSE